MTLPSNARLISVRGSQRSKLASVLAILLPWVSGLSRVGMAVRSVKIRSMVNNVVRQLKFLRSKRLVRARRAIGRRRYLVSSARVTPSRR